MDTDRRYSQLVHRLFSARRAGVDFGLHRVQAALQALGHPETRIPVWVHIGGTNGKGSTATFVESIVRHAGKRTGLFTSPHLSQLCERFRVAGQMVLRSDVVAAAEDIESIGARDLTFFEQITLMALCLFARARVDVAVLEVGLGGRLDATNAVRADVAAVTGVALDHQDYLGNTLAAIAREKAGIFKSGQRAVIGAAGELPAVPLLVSAARDVGVAALTVLDPVEDAIPASWPVGLAGSYQRVNAACAVAIVDHLQELGALSADASARRAGLANASLPGRLEILARTPQIIVDGAHNPHAAGVLRRAMDSMPRPRILMVGVSTDKDVPGILAPLLPCADAVIATRCRTPRSMPACDLARMVGQRAPASRCIEEPDVPQALSRARELAGSNGTVLATGSLFLAGHVRQILCGDEADSIDLSDPLEIGPASGR